MSVILEEPCFVVVEKVLTRDGQLVEPPKLCPHGLKQSNTCLCANPLRMACLPPPLDGCHGFVVGLPAPDQPCH